MYNFSREICLILILILHLFETFFAFYLVFFINRTIISGFRISDDSLNVLSILKQTMLSSYVRTYYIVKTEKSKTLKHKFSKKKETIIAEV